MNIKEVLDAIEKGCITVRWSGWSFTGGRDWGNWHTFELLKGSEKIGSIDLATDYVNVEVNGETIFDIKEEITRAEAVLMIALARDDKELCAVITDDNGNIKLPEDNEDIDCKQIMEEKA